MVSTIVQMWHWLQIQVKKEIKFPTYGGKGAHDICSFNKVTVLCLLGFFVVISIH